MREEPQIDWSAVWHVLPTAYRYFDGSILLCRESSVIRTASQELG